MPTLQNREGWWLVVNAITEEDFTIVYPEEPDQSTRRLMEALGVKVAVRPGRPVRVVQSSSMEVAAHELLSTRVCKRPNCEGDATDAALVGPYAGLCDECREQASAERSRSARSRAGSEPELGGERVRIPLVSNGAGLASQVQQLVPVARRLEKAKGKIDGRRAAVDEAKDEARADLEAFKAGLAKVMRSASAVLGAE